MKRMALIDNIGNLVGTLVQANQNQEGQELAKRAGVNSNDFSKIASLGLPLLLQGMNKNTKDSSGLESFIEALNQHQTRNNYDNLSHFAQNINADDGDKIVNHVLSGEKEEVSTGLAERLGVDSQTVKSVLAILAPIVLKFLADKKSEKNLDAQAVQRETQDATQEAARQVRERSKDNQLDLGLDLGMIGGLLGFGNGKDSNKQQKDSGLLGDLFNLLK